LQGCQECEQITDPFERFHCQNECSNFCSETYPKL
jgi:hypothetical protein